jgi:CRISPR-associated protein Cmr4
MQTKLLYLFTRTPLHVGCGASVGAIDQPIQRERHTGFPIIPGSSIKGVLRDHLAFLGPDTINEFFGKGGTDNDGRAGAISFGEARLVAFPVRSAKGAFALAVSPLTLQRLARDAGWDLAVPDYPGDMSCLAGVKVIIDQSGQRGVVLEEYSFKVAGDFPSDWASRLSELLEDSILSDACGRFVLLSDGDFSHFTVTACQVNQHVAINDKTGTAVEGALFNEETVPAETLFYSPLTVLRKSSGDNAVFSALEAEQLVQIGGDSTTGLGFCTVKLG